MAEQKLVADEVIELFDKMKATFVERRTQYKDNYYIIGRLFVAMFPDGITLRTEEDFIRFDFFHWSVSKMTRFVASGLEHQDSIYDQTVYTAMLAAWTNIQAQSKAGSDTGHGDDGAHIEPHNKPAPTT